MKIKLKPHPAAVYRKHIEDTGGDLDESYHEVFIKELMEMNGKYMEVISNFQGSPMYVVETPFTGNTVGVPEFLIQEVIQ